VEILRNLNFKSLILDVQIKMHISRFIILSALLLSFLLVSCSKKPAELYDEGMKSFTAGNYEKAQESFSDGIKKSVEKNLFVGNDSLYAGFIAANLVTGKYAPINSAYNDFTDGIHAWLVNSYGERAMKMVGVTKEIIPYKPGGGNRLPPDFPQTVAVQAIADHQGFANMRQQIDSIIKK
jgi:hypothetical protein